MKIVNRLILTILVIFSVIWLWHNRLGELYYHTLAPVKLNELGDAVGFDAKSIGSNPNSYVSVTGVLGNKAASIKGLIAGSFRIGRYQVRHLLGSKLYIEYDEEKYHKTFSPFKTVSVKGRLVSFGPNSELQKVRDFFKSYHNKAIDDNAMLIVVDEEPRTKIRYALLFVLSLAIVILSIFFTAKEIFKKANSP